MALAKYDFLHEFDGIVMSGAEKTRKPFPDFYKILLHRYEVLPDRALFIDDNLRNIQAALSLGIPSIHFESPESLRSELLSRRIL